MGSIFDRIRGRRIIPEANRLRRRVFWRHLGEIRISDEGSYSGVVWGSLWGVFWEPFGELFGHLGTTWAPFGGPLGCLSVLWVLVGCLFLTFQYF